MPEDIDQVRKAYDMEEDDETGMENFRIKVVDHPLLNCTCPCFMTNIKVKYDY